MHSKAEIRLNQAREFRDPLVDYDYIWPDHFAHIYSDCADPHVGLCEWLDEIERRAKFRARVRENCIQLRIEREAEKRMKRFPFKATKPVTGKHGYVYLIKSGTEYWKIGMTVDLNQRFESFCKELDKMPRSDAVLGIYHWHESENAEDLERLLHWVFGYRRERVNLPCGTEWFKLTDDEVRLFCSVAWESARKRRRIDGR